MKTGRATRITERLRDFMELKVEYLGFSGKIDQMGSAIENHIGEKLGLVNLTGLGARNSDSDRDFLLDKVG